MRSRGRSDRLPILAILCAQDRSIAAHCPSHCFRWRGAGKKIGSHAARLRLPTLALIGGALDAPGGTETPENAAARRSEDDSWICKLRKIFRLPAGRRARRAIEVLPFGAAAFRGG